MIKHNSEFEKEYYEIIKTFMLIRFPEAIIDGTKYKLLPKHLTVDLKGSSFYFDLDTTIYHRVPIFRNKGVWHFPLLNFGIQLTASTGRTYSYPKINCIPIKDKNELLLYASYMFNCIDIAIHFFNYEYRKSKDSEFKNPLENLYDYTFVSGGVTVHPPKELMR